MSFAWFDEFKDMMIGWGITAVGGLALIVIGFLVARLVRGTLSHAFRRLGLGPQLTDVLALLAYYLTIAVVVIAAFGVMGIETASLITILGTCTLAIGLALQGSLSNFASGIMLFAFRPFRIGDLIETGDYIGHVTETGVFSTKINTLQNIRVEIPNAYISQRPVHNWNVNEKCRIDLLIEVAIEADFDQVKAAILAALARHAQVLAAPAPFVGVDNYGDSSAILVVRPWCRSGDYWTLKFELPQLVKHAAESVNIPMPTPRREIVVLHDGEQAAEPGAASASPAG